MLNLTLTDPHDAAAHLIHCLCRSFNTSLCCSFALQTTLTAKVWLLYDRLR